MENEQASTIKSHLEMVADDIKREGGKIVGVIADNARSCPNAINIFTEANPVIMKLRCGAHVWKFWNR